MILFCSSSTTSPPQRCTKISWNCMLLTLPTRKPLPLKTFMKELMFWLQTLLLSALNHQKNLQSHIWWHLKSLLSTWNNHFRRRVLHYTKMNGLSVHWSPMMRPEIQSRLISFNLYRKNILDLQWGRKYWDIWRKACLANEALYQSYKKHQAKRSCFCSYESWGHWGNYLSVLQLNL